MERGLDRIRDEMAAGSKNPMESLIIETIGDFLTGYIETHPKDEHLFAAEGKSIASAYKELEAYARTKPRSGNCVAIRDDEGFGVILKYYGIENTQGKAAQPKPSRIDDEFDLDKLMEV